MVGNCSQKCSCAAGELICEFFSCDNNSYCITRSGVEQCFCKDGYEGDGVYCETRGERKELYTNLGSVSSVKLKGTTFVSPD